eukprot:scaffold90263_cov69-Phaeocystis_antarctica.AAC.1
MAQVPEPLPARSPQKGVRKRTEARTQESTRQPPRSFLGLRTSRNIAALLWDSEAGVRPSPTPPLSGSPTLPVPSPSNHTRQLRRSRPPLCE